MITWTASTQTPQEHTTDLLVLLVGSGWEAETQAALGALASEIAPLAREEGFEGKGGQSFLLHTRGALPARRVALLGRGELATGYDTKELGARVAQLARKARAAQVSVAGAPEGAQAAGLLAEGLMLGAYRFDHHKSKAAEGPALERAALLVSGADAGVEAALEGAQALAVGVTLARDLVNEPPNVCTPSYLAEAAATIAAAHGMALTVLNEDEIAQKGMNLLHAVGRGSNAHHASRFIHLVWKGAGEVTRRLAFVGKGVTFDTGGYSLKPAAGMFNMHGDMAGAAAVLGAAEVIGRRKPAGVEVHFIVPSAVNMVSADAYLLNEIITGYGKKTVEINNTDAEGRLLLADALSYAAELGVDEIIDLATLTGACVVALGEHYSALFSNREEMAQRVLAASKEAGERMWPMPLDARLKDKLKSVSADMKNAGDRWGGAITAALFLQEWVGEVSWTHLDIAGPSFAEADAPLTPRGGTGVAVATLARYAGA